MDMSQYRTLFISEAREYVRSISGLIVDLEKDPADRDKIDAVFRVAHSIKGMAASMEYHPIADLAHRLEDLMTRVRKDVLVFDSGIADLLLEGADVIEAMIADVESDVPIAGTGVESLMERIACYEPVDGATPPAIVDSPVIAVPADEGILPEPEDSPLPALRRKSDMGGSDAPQTVRVKTAVLDHLINLTGELITTKHRLVDITREAGSTRLLEAVTDLSRLLRGLHDEVMLVRLMPLSVITDRFPRLARDLAKKNGKDAELVIDGQEIELDRGILEELSDPLTHIIRNAVDHGIEHPEERTAAGKAARGTIRIRARRERDQVIITVEDDGRGIDPGKLVAAAVDGGFMSAASASQLSLPEVLLLTCLPGFSTAQEITEVSGRGVGMDAVRSTIQSLCGTLGIESECGKGTRMILKLPLTAAIINVLLIAAGPFTVAVPVMNVIKTLEVTSEMLRDDGVNHWFSVGDEEIPLMSLQRVFTGISAPVEEKPAFLSLPVFVCETRGRKVGFFVDRFLGHQEAFIKPLGRPLHKLKGISGGAILGDGKIVFLLDVANLV